MFQPPCDSAYAELICHLCSEKYHEAFLFAYEGFSVSNVGKKESGEEVDANVEISEDKNISINEPNDSEASEEVCKVSDLSPDGSTDRKGEKEKEMYLRGIPLCLLVNIGSLASFH